MSLWGSIDQANNAPKNQTFGGLGVAANGVQTYSNSQIGGLVSGIAVGTWGANVAEVGNTTIGGNLTRAAHPGWQKVIVGTGPVLTISVATTGNNFNSGQNGYVQFSGYGSGANALWTANVTGHVNTVVLLAPGVDFNVAPTGIGLRANANGTNATFTTTVGGRAGRVQVETIVTLNTMT